MILHFILVHLVLWIFRESYVVFLKVAHVTQHSDPHQHGAGAQENAADVITCQSLQRNQHVIQEADTVCVRVCLCMVPLAGWQF